MKRKSKKSAGRSAGSSAMLLRLPASVAAALAADAESSKRTSQAVVIGLLAFHYGIEVREPKRGRPGAVDG